MTDYSPEDTTKALALVVAKRGDVAEAAREIGMPYRTLRQWVDETHRTEYEELERRHGAEVEAAVIHQELANMRAAAKAKAELIERARAVSSSGDIGNALRAVSDAGKKSADTIGALSGRDGGDPEDPVAALMGLVKLGVVKMHGDVKLTFGDPDIEGSATVTRVTPPNELGAGDE